MIRVNLVLLVAVVASALYLVNVQYESRRLFSDLDRARAQARRLEADKERLQVEKRAQATPLRVERLAKTRLRMRAATPDITLYVSHSAGTSSVAGVGDAESGSGSVGAAGLIE